MNLALHSALKKKYKDLLLNFQDVNLREDIWRFFQENANHETKFANIEEFLKHVIDYHHNWIEDMVEYAPHRKEYWDKVLDYGKE